MGMKLGVLGPEGGAFTGYTADVVGGGPPGGYHEVKPADQWAGGPQRVSWTPAYTNPPYGTDPGRHAGYDSNILPGGSPPGRSLDARSRFPSEAPWPQGGMVSRRINDRNYDVQEFTGYSYGTVAGSNWSRGSVAKWSAPTLRPGKPPIMYDPTDPDTWDQVRAFN